MPADASRFLRPGERLDDLQRGSLRILQRPDGFCFGMDAVLLAAFASARAGSGKAIDLGTGSGILPLLLCARVPDLEVDAVEIQPAIADMARRSVALNGLEGRIRVHTLDLREAPRMLGHEQYRLAIANPPYGQAHGGMQNPCPERRTARHEGEADIQAVCKAAGALLQNRGRFDLIFPAARLLSLCDALRAARIEPKRIRLIHPRWGAPPNLALVEGVKNARPALHFLPPLFVRGADGHETDEIRQIYQA